MRFILGLLNFFDDSYNLFTVSTTKFIKTIFSSRLLYFVVIVKSCRRQAVGYFEDHASLIGCSASEVCL